MKLKKLLAGITAAAMAVSMASFSVFAADGGEGEIVDDLPWEESFSPGAGYVTVTLNYKGDNNALTFPIGIEDVLMTGKSLDDVESVNCEIIGSSGGTFTADIYAAQTLDSSDDQDIVSDSNVIHLSNAGDAAAASISADDFFFDTSKYIIINITGITSAEENLNAKFGVTFEYKPSDTTDMSKVPDEVNVDFISSPTAFEYTDSSLNSRYIYCPIEIPGVKVMETTWGNLKKKDVKINLNNISFGYITVNGEKADIGPEDLDIELVVHFDINNMFKTFDFVNGSSINTSLTQLPLFESEEYPNCVFEDCEYIVEIDYKVLEDLNISPTDTVIFYPTAYVAAPAPSDEPPVAVSAGIPGAIIGAKKSDNETSKASGSTSVKLEDPSIITKELIDSLSDKENVEFQLDNGASWEIDGSDLGKAENMDLGITLNTKDVTTAQAESVSKESETMQFRINYDGQFGFTAKLNIPVAEKYNGQYANLYWLNNGKLEYVGSSLVENKIATFDMDHASSYIIFFNRVSFSENIAAGAGIYADESGTSSAAPIAVCISFAALAAVSAVIIKKKSIITR